MVILDCTLRDGGYYNNWEFSKTLVEKYLAACNDANIDYVELGLRMPPSEKFLGPHAYTTEGYIGELSIPADLKLGVMINTKHFLGQETDIKDYFFHKKDSQISLVRVASHFHEIERSLEIVKELKDLGYTVGLNLMQIGIQDEQTIVNCLKAINNSPSIDTLYFADSLGNMQEEEVEYCLNLLRTYWKGDVGIHAHNNMNQALRNTLYAMKKGVSWMDGTVLGMGRGAGNVQMEYLLYELVERGHSQYDSSPLFPLVLDEFAKLRIQHNWGSSILYYLAAKSKIHPSFIQDLANNSIYNHLDQINAISALSKVDSTKYKHINTMEILHNQADHPGENLVLDISSDRDVLLLANGPSLKKYSGDIEQFIKTKSPYVISLNINSTISNNLIDLYSFCNPARILTSIQKISKLEKDILIPVSQLNDKFKDKMSACKVHNYGLSINSEIGYDKKGCSLESPLVLGFTLSALMSNGQNKFFMAGFDGYVNQNENNENVNRLIEDLSALNNHLKLISITPTNFNIIQRSVFSNGVIYDK